MVLIASCCPFQRQYVAQVGLSTAHKCVWGADVSVNFFFFFFLKTRRIVLICRSLCCQKVDFYECWNALCSKRTGLRYFKCLICCPVLQVTEIKLEFSVEAQLEKFILIFATGLVCHWCFVPFLTYTSELHLWYLSSTTSEA